MFGQSSDPFQLHSDKDNANNVAERLRKMSIRFSVVIHTYNAEMPTFGETK